MGVAMVRTNMAPGTKVSTLARTLEAFAEKNPPHTALPTERQLARQFGVSRETVRRALDRLVFSGQVLRRRPAGNFVAPTRRGRTVLFVSHDFVPNSVIPTLLPPCLFAFLRAVRGADLSLLPAHCPTPLFLEELGHLKAAYPDLSAIVIFQQVAPVVALAPLLKQLGLPVLYIGSDRLSLPPSMSALLYREEEVITQAFTLLGLGPGAPVGIWASRDDDFTHWRLDVFEKEAKRRQHKVVLVPGFFKSPGGLGPELKRWLKIKRKPLPILTLHDSAGIRLVHEILAAGLTLPKDYQVASVEGLPLGEMAMVPLSAVGLPMEEAGLRCVPMLLDLLGGGKPRVEYLPVNPRPRASTAPKMNH